jgi:hypothetical protein
MKKTYYMLRPLYEVDDEIKCLKTAFFCWAPSLEKRHSPCGFLLLGFPDSIRLFLSYFPYALSSYKGLMLILVCGWALAGCIGIPDLPGPIGIPGL